MWEDEDMMNVNLWRHKAILPNQEVWAPWVEACSVVVRGLKRAERERERAPPF